MKPYNRLLSVFRRRQFDAEMAEEMRAHVEMQTERNIAAGMKPGYARFAALRQFGNVAGIQERAREGRGWVWLEQLGQDLRYAVRQLVRAKGFTAVVVLTLALGIGATTAIYSVVDAVIMNPLPGPAPERLMQFGERVVIQKQEHLFGVSPPTLVGALDNRDFFADFTWFDFAQLPRRGSEFTTMHGGAFVAPNFFSMLGAQPLLGRMPTPAEATTLNGSGPTKDGVIVLSHAWWEAEFAGDPKILGATIELGEHRFTVIGVMRAYFQYPNSWGEYWIPAEPLRPEPRIMRASNIHPIVRLKPGVTAQQTQAMLDTLAQRLMQDYPAGDNYYGATWRTNQRPAGLRLWLRPLLAEFQDGRGAEEIRRTLLGFLAAIGFVLVIVCANVAGLTLARTERRQHELAVRAALGAGRARLTRQLLTENLLLAGLGGVAGLVVTAWCMKLFAAMSTQIRVRPITVDAQVLGVALLVTLLTGLAFGLAPAWRAGRARLNETLAQGTQNATAGGRGSRFRGGLVVVQVALTVVLLTGAGLMLRSVVRLLHANPGYDPANLLAVFIPPGTSFDGANSAQYKARRNAGYGQLHERLAALPGVKAVGILKVYTEDEFRIDGRTNAVRVHPAGCGVEGSDFFRAMRIPLLAGRYFTRDDIGEGIGAVVINESMAQLCWLGDEAIGRTFRSVGQREDRLYKVIGVVGDARLDGFDEAAVPTFYRPYQDFGGGLASFSARFVIRTERDPALLVPAIRRELKAVDARMHRPPIVNTRQMLFDRTQAQRTYRNYLVAFAGVGLVLSALGIYAVLAYSVAQRTREIGIRIAIGADRNNVVALVMGQGARLIAIGVATGLLAAFWLTQFLQKQLFETDPHDSGVLAGVVVVLSAVSLFACWLPARRAANVDPMVALRTE